MDWNLVVSLLTLVATIGLGYVAYKISEKYSKRTDKFNKDTIFHQLFRDFNSRYSRVNFALQELLDKCQDENYALHDLKKDGKLHDQIMDYFNICCEEYYWRKKGRIPNDVWNAWEIGMNNWYSNIPVLRELWKQEISGDGYKSYYLKEGDNLFKE